MTNSPPLPLAAPRRAARLLSLLALCGALVGCTDKGPAQFRLNKFQAVQAQFQTEQQQTIADVLGAMFGTPDEPFALPETGLDLVKLRAAAGPVATDEDGTPRGLYRRHCVHCHGVSGDGAGPTAAFLNPYPRDYRQGKFKFKSTEYEARPTGEDLKRVLIEGVPGTAMPSFRLLSNYELDALVEYVKYLSMRGEMETKLVQAISDLSEGEQLDTSADELISGDFGLETVLRAWHGADDAVVYPDPTIAPLDSRSREELQASIDAGRALFFSARADCVKCHGVTEIGDGELNDFDDWNKAVNEYVKTHAGATAESLGALPVRTIMPRNLRQGVYRGGRRPLDVYRKIHAGIRGTPMPGFKANLTPEEIWQIVDYVQSLPYESISRPSRSETSIQRERM